ncbi:MAG: hypothetical protein U0802_11775 [Candidatus Binatia bacterium]
MARATLMPQYAAAGIGRWPMLSLSVRVLPGAGSGGRTARSKADWLRLSDFDGVCMQAPPTGYMAER